MAKDPDDILLGITIGDINGIGSELIIKTLLDERLLNYFTPVIFGSSRVISYHRKVLNLPDFKYNIVRTEAGPKKNMVNIVNCWEEEVKVELGEASELAGKYALNALDNALKRLSDKKIDGLVTCPVNKHTIKLPEGEFTGHTGYIMKAVGADDHLMMMVSEDLKVGLVTSHIPLKDVSQHITKEAIASKLNIFNKSLKNDFGVGKPKIAVLGLNPHAGDAGLLGQEESEIITPAIEAANKEQLLVFGPYSADAFFGSFAFKNFDGVLSMYHDQGLVGFKALSFDSGVNYSAGLPIVRTSPDHGPAYDIAGKNIASVDSFRNSLYLARDIIRNRKENKEAKKEVVKIENTETSESESTPDTA